jgi:hypothetical protein
MAREASVRAPVQSRAAIGERQHLGDEAVEGRRRGARRRHGDERQDHAALGRNLGEAA